jgi:hypothetical protein
VKAVSDLVVSTVTFNAVSGMELKYKREALTCGVGLERGASNVLELAGL